MATTGEVSIRAACRQLGFSKQAYYKGQTNQHRTRNQMELIKQEVLSVRRQMPRLGTRKLYYLLKESFQTHQLKLGRDKLFDLLRSDCLLIVKKKKYTKTTNSKHWMRKYPNLIKNIKLYRPEQLWVADITYIDTQDKNSYLHLITDAYSKQIMGYELSENMEAVSTLKALKMAIKNRKYPHEILMHHSDRGLQYCSTEYVRVLNKNNIQISMTENGDPYENAVAERMNGILKDEFGLGEKLENVKQAKRQLIQSVETYNELRPHLTCHMLTPMQMHEQQTIKLKKWNKKTSNILMNV